MTTALSVFAAHMGTDFFSEGGKSASKSELTPPPKGSREVVKFWVTKGGKGGGQKKFSTIIEDHTETFCAFFAPFGTFSSNTLSKIPDFFCLREGGYQFFFEGSQFSALG